MPSNTYRDQPITPDYSTSKRQRVLKISVYTEIGKEKSGVCRANMAMLLELSQLEYAWDRGETTWSTDKILPGRKMSRFERINADKGL